MMVPRRASFPSLYLATVLAAAPVLGCGRSRSSDQLAVTAAYDVRTGQLKLLRSDRNRDGHDDAWVYMAGTRMLRAEVDENGDNCIDRWETYADDGAAAGTSSADQTAGLIRVAIAERRNGIVSRTEFYDRARLTRSETDTDGNGAIDKWETYDDGVLERVLIDTTGRGSPDSKLTYDRNGGLASFEIDPDNDGRFERVPDTTDRP
jgi:hypothetical protein